MRRWARLWAHGLTVIAACLSTGACQTMGSGVTKPPVSAACLAFQPIRWSSHDTLETQKQARAHNAAGASLCGWKS